MNLDNLALIIATPVVLIVAFFIGAFVRGLLVKDDYKLNTAAIIINIIMGIISLIIIGKATR